MNQLLHALLGLGLATKTSYSITDRLLGFLALVPPIFLFLTPLNAASAVVLSIRGYPPWNICILGLLTVAFAGGGVIAFNNYIDRERDMVIWPQRSIPNGRVKANGALATATLSFICALLLSWFFFNAVNFFILLASIALGCLYSAYLRDRVGYLSLPPIVGLIYLGGWAAVSPETLFTSLLPWYLYLLGLVWQVAHIMVYYPVHITPKVSGKPDTKLPPALLFTPSPRLAVGIAVTFLGLALVLSTLLPLLTPLSPIYLILVLGAGIYTLVSTLQLLGDVPNREKGLRTFTSLTVFRLTISVAILLDILICYQI